MSREEGIGSGVQVEGSFFQKRRRVTSVEIRKRRENGTNSGRFILLIMRGQEISSSLVPNKSRTLAKRMRKLERRENWVRKSLGEERN